MGRHGKKKTNYRRQLKDTSRGARVNRGRFASSSRKNENKELDAFDRAWGYEIFRDNAERRERLGWLLNVLPTTVADESRLERSAVDLFFLEQNGKKFKTTIMYNPYFYVAVREPYHKDVSILLERKFEGIVASIEIVRKEDLDMPNHLSGKQGVFLKLSFRNVQDLLSARRVLFPIVDANRKSEKTSHHSTETEAITDFSRMILGIREYDVPYYVRCMIDLDFRVGAWYKVVANKSGNDNKVEVLWQKDMLLKANPSVLAFDIECTKSPLKFPDADIDEIFMISYMVDGKGYLIVSRTVVSKNISDFEYTPKAEYPGPFKVFNEVNEEALIRRFFKHIRELCPDIIVTYNGDFFDFPFVDRRAQIYGLNLKSEIGIEVDRMGESYVGRTMSHMDAFSWVRRDSYLPQGSQGLKNVTKYKLGYNPVEVDPEDMVRFAVERPDHMASYSVSDAVATYYLYMKYVHLFIFSLCTVIPMRAEDVLRKGSGTLCEMLLQVEAYRGNIICPNKQRQRSETFHKGHLLDAETYVGGHVESLESGVFRSDLPCKFNVDPKSYQMLIDNIDRALTFSVEVEYGIERSEIANYDEVRSEIVHQLELIRDRPVRDEIPFIYHLDVAAMYPNIILTNRLQPSAIVDASTCAACDYNRPGANCRRKMPWTWRGDMFPAKRSEYEALKTQLEYESVDGVPFHKLPYPERNAAVRARLKTYSQTVYKKTKKTEEEVREAVVCQRENSFYVNTVRSFRDRRYDYKGLKKKWSRAAKAAKRVNDVVAAEEARNKTLLYDSLQLAHKCILNSFYGYVMRKGARWHSMEMAGVVTKTGANLIKQARILVEGIGRPLELDTDGIWCILPGSFPENFTFELRDGKKINISYPCVMLNVDVHENYTNHQYQVLKKGSDRRKPQYTTRSECSIFFEVDGPYRCMVLPASTEEGKLLKKRYAVFNFDGSLAELKGFELKRRGELKIVKIFQSQVFKQFLKGQSLKECYDAVAEIANRWIDVLATHGDDMEDDEVIELISENRSMSRALKEYGDQKSTSITTARRLGEFLGDEMVKDKGLQCKMIISRMPAGAPVTERAVPTAIFSADLAQRQHFLRKWCKDKSLSGSDIDVRSIVDWDYYMERLSTNIRKIITIPAALQKQKNPVPRVAHPAWLVRKVRSENDGRKQLKINDMFTKNTGAAPLMDIENVGDKNTSNQRGGVPRVTVKKRKSRISFSKKRTTSQTFSDDTKMEIVEEKEADEEEEEENVDESTFEGWLKSRKKKWRDIRAQNVEAKNLSQGRRQHLRSSSHGSNNKNQPIQNQSLTSTKNNSFATFARSAGSNVLRGYWQIVRITASSNPGFFTVWAFTSTSTIESISIRIPRVFYVNSTTPNPKGGERVERTLPHGRDSKYLYRIEVDEEKWIRRSKRLDRLVMDADIEGVYELQTPLLLRAILTLGCVARVGFERSRRIRDRSAFELTDLDFLTTASHSYLNPSSCTYRRLFLYHSSSTSDGGGRGVWALFTFSKTNVVREEWRRENTNEDEDEEEKTPPLDATAIIWLVGRGADQETVSLKKLWEKYRQSPEDRCVWDVRYAKSEKKVRKQVSKAIVQATQLQSSANIMLAQTCESLGELMAQIPALSSLPVIPVPRNNSDNAYPTLGWQRFACEQMMQRATVCSEWWDERVSLALYAHIPAGNLGNDAIEDTADVFYCRLLKQSRHILWTSQGTIPDLGGHEQDENRMLLSEQMFSSAQRPEVHVPGAYRSICVELELHGLAVNTLVNASFLNDIEGSSMLDNSAACSAALTSLQQLVTNWYRDVKQTGNLRADELLGNFYRWLCSPTSRVFDPALVALVQSLVQKVFLELLNELRSLGAEIVHASFNKFVLCTKRVSMANARSYYRYLVDTVKTKPLFSVIEMTPTKWWRQLIFMDMYNYGGVEIEEEEEEEGIDDEKDVMSSPSSSSSRDTTAKRVVSEWDISRHLPPLAKRHFEIIVAYFVIRPVQWANKMQEEQQNTSLDLTQAVTTKMDEEDEDEGESSVTSMTTYLQRLVDKDFTDLMHKMACELVSRRDSEARTFPKLAGSHLDSNNAALEFVKRVCHVLALDKDVHFQVERLKKYLFRLIGQREFSASTHWKNPSLSFVLPDVICSFCNGCEKLDLLRNSVLTDTSLSRKDRWRCVHCNNPYNLAAIEMRLVQQLQNNSMAYQLQDLSCEKCGEVKGDNLGMYCTCSSKFRNAQESSDTFRKRLRVFKNVADFHEFGWLKETVGWLSR